MYGALLHEPGRERFDTSGLTLCVSGGSALPVELLRGFEHAFGCKMLEGYGLSETSPVASFNHPDRERKPGSIGTPIEGVEMKVVDDEDDDVPQGEVGEIVIRGHNVMKGYWQRPDATAETIRDGWFHTGDMATVDEDGYFFIVDRKKDMIIRGGYNVYPREIEEVLYEHPAVREAAVVGVPRRRVRRGGRRRGRAQGRRRRERRGAARLRQGAGRGVQVPAPRVVRRRAAEGPDREDPQARDRAARRTVERRRPHPRRRAERRRAAALDDHRAGRLRARGRSGHRDASSCSKAALFEPAADAEAVIAELGGTSGRIRAVLPDASRPGSAGPACTSRTCMSRPRTAAAASAARCWRMSPVLAIERGCTRLEWSALDWNAPAIGFYEQLGAERLHEWEGFRLSRSRARRRCAGGGPIGPMSEPASRAAEVSLRTIAREWLRIGVTGFGGPPTHIALLRRLVVERRHWIDARELEDAIAACNLLPGPASTQLAIFCARRLAGGPAGAIIGGLVFRRPCGRDGDGALGVVSRELAADVGHGRRRRRRRGGRRGRRPRRRRLHRTERQARRSDAPPGAFAGSCTSSLGALRGARSSALPRARVARLRRASSSALRSRALRDGLHAHAGGLIRRYWLPPRTGAGGLGALAWVAFKVGALSYGGGFVIVPLMRTDAVHTYHWMSSTQFLSAVALGQVTPGPVVATVAAVGYAAHGVGGGALAAAIAFAPSFAFVLARRPATSSGCARNPRAEAFLDGAGPAAIGAILGAAIPLAAALDETWQFVVLAVAAVALLLARLGIVRRCLPGAAGAAIAIAGGPLPR